jgi:hypothetical protein
LKFLSSLPAPSTTQRCLFFTQGSSHKISGSHTKFMECSSPKRDRNRKLGICQLLVGALPAAQKGAAALPPSQLVVAPPLKYRLLTPSSPLSLPTTPFQSPFPESAQLGLPAHGATFGSSMQQGSVQPRSLFNINTCMLKVQSAF